MLTESIRPDHDAGSFVVVLLLLLAAFCHAQDGPYQVSLQHNVMVPMRDGVRLADRCLSARRRTASRWPSECRPS